MQTTPKKHFLFTEGIKNYLPALMLVLFVAVEFYSKYIAYQGHETNLQKIIKAVFLAVFLAALLVQFKKLAKQLLLLGMLVLVFVIAQFTVDPSFSNYNLLTLSRFIFPVMLFLYFTLYKPSSKGRKCFFSAFEYLLLGNSLLLIIGVFTDLYVLKTYTGDRFGYNGVFLTSSTSTYVYYFALGYFYFTYKQAMLRNWKFWVVVASCLLVGTKSLYLGFVLFVIVVLLDSTLKHKKLILALGGIASITGLYVILYHVPQFVQIREQEGIITSILSYRDQLFLDQTLPYIQENWKLVNYLFGGVADFTLRSQMDFIDVFFFWGILGGILYLSIYGKTFFSFNLKPAHWFYFLSVGAMVCFAGNFFTYTSVPLYLVLVREAILHNSVTKA
jgi:hypothetical protein